MQLTLRSCRTFSFSDGTLKKETERLMVLWYGPVTPNRSADSVPKIYVYFRTLDGKNNLGNITRRQVALTHLGLLRIGSIWHKGVSNAYFPYQEEKFDVNFSEEGWRVISLNELRNRGHTLYTDFLRSTGLSENNKYATYLIEFFMSDGKSLLVPCVEYFSRCYGFSSEVRRVLATYSWEKVKSRLFKPIKEPSEPGTWPVKLNWRVNKSDAILLAHILHDPYAERAAKNIYSHIEKDFSARHPYSLLKATPWFQGEGQLAVAGAPLDGGKTFLALRILGSTQPGGAIIQREKEKRIATEGGSGNNGITGWSFNRRLGSEDIIDLTDDVEPDHGASWLDIPEKEFTVLGKPRKVVDKRLDRGGSANTRNTPRPGDETSFSTGEAYSSEKGIGKAYLYASLVMESQGMLRDIWEAFCYVCGQYPEHIQKIEWFTFKDGFSSSPDPKLIRLNAIENDESISTGTLQWPFFDHDKRQLRGVLVIRVISEGKHVYIVEVQRKIRKNDPEKGKEDSMSGLCFTLDNNAEFEGWLRKLLSDIRYKQGVFKKIVGECPGRAETFMHRNSKDNAVLFESTAKNALKKMGVELY